MIRRTMLIRVKPQLAEGIERLEEVLRRTREEVPGVLVNSVARNLRCSEFSPWTHVWDFTLRDLQTVQTYRTHAYHKQVIMPIMSRSNEAVTYIYFEPVHHRSSNAPGQYKHSVVMEIDPGATGKQIAELDRRFIDLAGGAPGAPNWCVGAVDASVQGSSWSRIWEFEFSAPEDFTGYWEQPLRETLLANLASNAKVTQRFAEVQIQPDEPIIQY